MLAQCQFGKKQPDSPTNGWKFTLNQVGTPFADRTAALLAGGEYAVALAEKDLENRIKEYEEKKKSAAKTKSRLDNNQVGFKPILYREYCGKICCIASGKDKSKFYYQRELKGNLAIPGVDGGSCNMTGAPQCNDDDKPVGSYHNHPPSYTRARLMDDDKKGARDGKPPYGERVFPGGPEGMPKNQPISVTQRDQDGTFSTQIYDPSAPVGGQIQNFEH